MKRLARLIPHFSIALAGMFITFWILDIINPTMNFTGRKLSNKLLLVFCILAIVTSAIAIYYERKARAEQYRAQEKEDEK